VGWTTSRWKWWCRHRMISLSDNFKNWCKYGKSDKFPEMIIEWLFGR
jgi:hypothetical protein